MDRTRIVRAAAVFGVVVVAWELPPILLGRNAPTGEIGTFQALGWLLVIGIAVGGVWSLWSATRASE